MSAKRWVLLGLLLVACVLPFAGAAETAGLTLIVIPARYTVVQFAFDVAKLRQVYLVAYDTEGKSQALVLYVWDSGAGEWLRTSLEEYRSGAIFLTQPERVIVIGADQDVPAGMMDASLWSDEVGRIPSIKIVDMVNGMHQAFSFKASEWRWLAKRYKLELEDRNEERRRYGRYGPPGRKQRQPDLSHPEPDVVVMPMSLDAPAMVPVMPEEPELGERAPVVEKDLPEEKGVSQEKNLPEEEGLPEEKGLPEKDGEPVSEPASEEKGMPEDTAPEDK